MPTIIRYIFLNIKLRIIIKEKVTIDISLMTVKTQTVGILLRCVDLNLA